MAARQLFSGIDMVAGHTRDPLQSYEITTARSYSH